MNKKQIEFICVDFQKDFVDEQGRSFIHGTSVSFVKNTLIPFLCQRNLLINEITSDYRLPRLGRKTESCAPGTAGFESEIPAELKKGVPWIKCMHSPIWTRKNIGNPLKVAGNPYQDPKAFERWLLSSIGDPGNDKIIILFGETMDCCILATAQELYFRGYKVKVLYEACDPMNERKDYKE